MRRGSWREHWRRIGRVVSVDSGIAQFMIIYVVVFAAMNDASEAAVKYAAAQHTAKAE